METFHISEEQHLGSPIWALCPAGQSFFCDRFIQIQFSCIKTVLFSHPLHICIDMCQEEEEDKENKVSFNNK
jgi:hypothetical protein